MPLRIDVVTAARQGMEHGLAILAEHVLAESRRLVPIEEGTLARSGFADADGLTAVVGYDTPYAVRQHEDLSLRHDQGRQAKYLEQPATHSGPAAERILGGALRGELGG